MSIYKPSISILFSGRGTNADSILNNIVNGKLNLKVKIIICNKKNALGIKMFEKYSFKNKVVDIDSYVDKKTYNLDLEKALNPEFNEYLILCGYMSKIPVHII